MYNPLPGLPPTESPVDEIGLEGRSKGLSEARTTLQLPVTLAPQDI